MKKVFPLLIVFFSIISCSDKNRVPKGILPKAKMQDVIWDMVSAGEFLNSFRLNKDSVDKMTESLKVYGQVFQFHHITREEFEKSYDWYRQHPDIMNVLLDSLSKRQNVTETPPGQQTNKRTDSLPKKLKLITDIK